MTFKQWLAELAKTTNELTWRINGNDEIRAYAVTYNTIVCPLTAVHFIRTRKMLRIDGYGDTEMGDTKLVCMISVAADMKDNYPALRQKMIEALGLSE